MTYERVRVIERSPFQFSDRLNLTLVYANQKPATNLLITSPLTTAEDGVCPLKDIDIQRAIKTVAATRLPFAMDESQKRWKRWNRGQFIYVECLDILVGKDSQSLDRLLHAHDARAVGRCFGFPETAIEAYLGERQPFMGTIVPANQPIELFAHFVFSRDYWKEEFRNTSVRWHDTIKRLSSVLYREAIACTRDEERQKSDVEWRDKPLMQYRLF